MPNTIVISTDPVIHSNPATMSESKPINANIAPNTIVSPFTMNQTACQGLLSLQF